MNRMIELLVKNYDLMFEGWDGDALKISDSIELQKLLIENGFDTPERREKLINLQEEREELQKNARKQA